MGYVRNSGVEIMRKSFIMAAINTVTLIGRVVRAIGSQLDK